MPSIAGEVRQFVVESFLFGKQETKLSDDDSFLESGVIDSTGILELVMFLEERYLFRVGDADLIPENLDSISRVARYVARKLAEGHGQPAAAGSQITAGSEAAAGSQATAG